MPCKQPHPLAIQVAITILNGSEGKLEGLLAWHVVALAVLTFPLAMSEGNKEGGLQIGEVGWTDEQPGRGQMAATYTVLLEPLMAPRSTL